MRFGSYCLVILAGLFVAAQGRAAEDCSGARRYLILYKELFALHDRQFALYRARSARLAANREALARMSPEERAKVIYTKQECDLRRRQLAIDTELATFNYVELGRCIPREILGPYRPTSYLDPVEQDKRALEACARAGH